MGPVQKNQSTSRAQENAAITAQGQEVFEQQQERHLCWQSPYRATDYRQLLADRKISCSMSAKGCCWDNAVVESFFSTLKHELGLDDDAKTLNSPSN